MRKLTQSKLSLEQLYTLYIPFKKDNKGFMYIGITLRRFRDRIKQNEADLRLKRPYSALERLAQTQLIKVDFKTFKFIFYQEAIIRESLEIMFNKEIAIRI